MPQVVGVRLRFAPKTLSFDPAGAEPVEGDRVVVETERGTEIGTVVDAVHDVDASDLPAPLKPVVRIADEADMAHAEQLLDIEAEAMPLFREAVREHKLDMKPIDVEYLFDGDKAVFYFAAEERVDFRDLVRDLAAKLKIRIDMRQVGVRDEARMIGGLGHCGEQLCCVRFGGEFQPVSIRMAKEQDLPLNPLKISGLCGRLMCCLRYEYDAYKDFKSRAPKKGAIIETPMGLGKVSDLNTPRETVSMRLEDGTSVTVDLGSMDCAKGTGCPCRVSREAMEAATEPSMAAALAAEVAARPGAPVRELRESEPAPKREGGGEPAKREGDGGQRKRRRRGGRGGGGGGGDASADKSAAPKPAAGPKPAPKQQAQPAEGGQAAAPRTGRRRRRRRGGGGGGSAESGS